MTNPNRWIAFATLSSTLLGAAPLASAQSTTDLAALSRAVYSLDAGDPKRVRAPVSLGGAEKTFRLPSGFKLLYGVKRSQGKIQAMAVEHLASGKVVIAFRGTRGTDLSDLLADMGIAARNVAAVVGVTLRSLKKMLTETVKSIGRAAKKVAKKAVKGLKKTVGKISGFFGRKKKNKKKKRSKAPTPTQSPVQAVKPELYREGKSESSLVKFLKKFVSKLGKHLPLHKKIAAAKAFVKKVLELKKSGGAAITKADLVITGHSLGGYLAQVVGGYYQVRTETFNAPGALHGGRKSSTLVTNHVRRTDVVGRLGRHIGKVLLYPDEVYKLFDLSQRYVIANHDMSPFIPTLKKAWRHLTGR